MNFTTGFILGVMTIIILATVHNNGEEHVCELSGFKNPYCQCRIIGGLSKKAVTEEKGQ